MWKRKIESWLESDAVVLSVGWRSWKWIESFNHDIHRWGLPVTVKQGERFFTESDFVDLVGKKKGT